MTDDHATFRRVLEPSNPNANSLSTVPPEEEPQRQEYDDEGFYIPDPDAPLLHKLNPCHYDHFDRLTPVQRFFETFGSHCKCCSGVRVFLLIMAWCIVMFDYPNTHPAVQVASMVLVLLVICAIMVDVVEGLTQYYEEKDEHDNRNT